jgi:hypothetical protein
MSEHINMQIWDFFFKPKKNFKKMRCLKRDAFQIGVYEKSPAGTTPAVSALTGFKTPGQGASQFKKNI